jgi:predicted RNA-binding protein YlxR (DUF448 family)
VGCNEQKNKKQLIRIVKDKEGKISVDFTGKAHGRGAYICPNEECLKAAQKKKSLNRAFGQEIPVDIYEKLIEELKNG